MKPKQIAMFDIPKPDRTAEKLKRKWENAFQKWSTEQFLDGLVEYGACGYGSMCDWCEDNSYGRPCVRALNAMCREKHIAINYTDYDFEKVWNGFKEMETMIYPQVDGITPSII